MSCPSPGLCAALGRHVHGRLYELWRSDPRYRARWAAAAGRPLADLEREFPPVPRIPPPSDAAMASERAMPNGPPVSNSDPADPAQLPCRHRRDVLRQGPCQPCRNAGRTTIPVWACDAVPGGECVLRGTVQQGGRGTLPVCLTCPQRDPAPPPIAATTSAAASDRTPPPDATVDRIDPATLRCRATILNRDGRPVPFADMYRGRSAFLVAGGPSLSQVDLSLLQQRGVLTLAINNAAALFRPQLWCSMDACRKFVPQIWRDPAVMKFVPHHRRHEVTKRRDALGHLVRDDLVHRHPNVWYYARSQGDFEPAAFLGQETFHWGCADDARDPDGRGGTRSVMFVALKLLYLLGVRTVFLLGTDFKMTEARPYAFPQAKEKPGVSSNNGLYRILRRRIELLLPYCAAAGYRLISVTPGSALNGLLPHWTLARALRHATEGVPDRLNTAGMY